MALYLAGRLTPTNVALLDAFRSVDPLAALVPLEDAVRRASPGDTVLARVDVLPTLDGIEPGLDQLDELERRGVLVVNPSSAIITAHDKLATALKLRAARVPHPRTAHVGDEGLLSPMPFPLVVKPRFGSWGRDVVRCADERELAQTLAAFADRPWFRSHGAIVQELVPPIGYDVRVLVARGRVVGAIQRVAAPGEWRTNVALGGHRVSTIPSAEACTIALEAAETIGGGFVGVDLLPTRHGYSVIELNGCVDFTTDYSFPGEDAFVEVARALAPAAVPALGAATLEALPALD